MNFENFGVQIVGFYGYVRNKFGYKISQKIRKIMEKLKRCLLNNNCLRYNKIKIFEICDFFSFLKIKLFYKKKIKIKIYKY